MLTVSCLAGILVSSLAIGAMAGVDDWTIQFRAGSSATIASPGVPGGSISKVANTLGNALAATNSQDSAVKDAETGVADPYDSTGPASVNDTSAFLGWYRPDWNSGTPGYSWLSANDTRLPLSTVSNYIKTWHSLLLWAAPNYPGTAIHLYVVFGSSANQPPAAINGQPIVYRLVMTYHPAGYVGQTEWILPNTARTVADIALPTAGALVTSPFDANFNQIAGYRFDLITPEPGSILALGAGLASFVGMIRRRKA